MAYLGLKQSELVKILKYQLPSDIKNLKGNETGLSFTLSFDHSIPLVPKSLPFYLEFNTYDENYLVFELSIDTDKKIINKFANKIIDLLPSALGDYLPDGITIEEGYLYIDINSLIEYDGIVIKIISADFSDNLLSVEFKI